MAHSGVGFWANGGRKLLALSFLSCALLVSAHGSCPNIRSINLKNRLYQLNEPGFTQGVEHLRLVKGHYDARRETPGSVSYLNFDIVKIAFGDLDGDGREEAAAAAVYGSNSGSFYLTDTYVFGCVGEKISLLDILKQSDIERDTGMDLQESIEGPVSIRHGELQITYGTEGNRPSPEFITTFRYRLRGGQLRPFLHPVSRQNRRYSDQ